MITITWSEQMRRLFIDPDQVEGEAVV